jgi:hypothetical protein
VSKTLEEIDQEATDLVGWLFVLWCQVGQLVPGEHSRDELQLVYLRHVRTRLSGTGKFARLACSARRVAAMGQVEELAATCCELGELVRTRAGQIARGAQGRPRKGKNEAGREPCGS